MIYKNFTRVAIILSFFFCFGCYGEGVFEDLAEAEYVNLKCTVKDKNTNRPIIGVALSTNVRSGDGLYDLERIEKISDVNGNVTFYVPRGTYSLKMTKKGFEEFSRCHFFKSNKGNSFQDTAFMVETPPCIQVAPLMIDFADTLSESKITIENGCGQVLSWKVVEDIPWLDISPIIGNSNTDVQSILTVKANRDSLDQENANTFFTIESNAVNGPVEVKVSIIK